MIHLGDCVIVMAGMPAESVDAVVTDPPYGLEFMGKGWDKFGAEIVKDVVARGGFQDGNGGNPYSRSRVAFGYGQKAAVAFGAWCEAWGREALRVTKPGGYLLAFGGTRTHHRLVCGLEDAGWIIRDELDWIYASGFPKGRANLKPAHEPIVLARKPGPLRPLNIEENRIGTFADGEYPTHTTAIGGSNNNWENARGEDGKPVYVPVEAPSGRWPSNLLLSDPELFDEPNPYVVGSGATTTVPGNYTRSTAVENWGVAEMHLPGDAAGDLQPGYGDSGGYSRFFIVPKADRSDREPIVRGSVGKAFTATMNDGIGGREHNPEQPTAWRENSHPTVKPTDLMRHLVRLVTPSGGTVLDPFLGSGSTAIACELEGFPWIGIEKEPEYVAIAEARLNGVQRGLGLDVGAPTKPRAKTGKYDGLAGKNGWYGRFPPNPREKSDEEPAA